MGGTKQYQHHFQDRESKMSDLAFGISKTAIQFLTDKVKSAIKEEAEKWQIVESDLVFIKGEFEMMQAFLEMGDAQHIKNNVRRTWVTQVHDLSHDTEDWMEFVLHLDMKRSWWAWCIRMVPSFMQGATRVSQLDEAVAEIKQLKARVEDVSRRRMRYDLIIDSAGSNPVARMQQTRAASTRALDIVVDATEAEKDHNAAMHLKSLIHPFDRDLKVMSVCGSGTEVDHFRTTYIVRQVYDDSEISSHFKYRAWLNITNDPSSFQEVIRNMVYQFLRNMSPDPESNSQRQEQEAARIADMRKFLSEGGFVGLDRHLDDLMDSQYRLLIVLEDLPSIAALDAFMSLMPIKKNGGRIIVSTKTLEIASMCIVPQYEVSVIRKFSAGHSIYVFHKDTSLDHSQGNPVSSKNDVDFCKVDLEEYIHASAYQSGSVIFFLGAQTNENVVRTIKNGFKAHKSFDNEARDSVQFHIADMFDVSLEDYADCFVVIDDLESADQWNSIKDKLISETRIRCIVVITSELTVARRCATSVQDAAIYFLQQKGIQYGYAISINGEPPLPEGTRNDIFQWRKSEVVKLYAQINLRNSSHYPHVLSVWGLPGVGKTTLVRTVYQKFLEEKIFESYAWVCAHRSFNIDGFGTDLYFAFWPKGNKKNKKAIKVCKEHLQCRRCLIVIDGLTSETDWESIKNSLLSPPPHRQTCFVVITRNESVARYCAQKEEHRFCIDTPYVNDRKEAECVINEFGRLPAVVQALRSYLASKPDDTDVVQEIMHLKANFMRVLDTSPELNELRDVLKEKHSSFNDFTQVLKKCTFYLSIFPRSSIIERKRLVRRWVAEGYSKGSGSISIEDYTEKLFQKLVDLGIIEQPTQTITTLASDMRMASFRVVPLFLGYIMTRETEEKNFVPLEVTVLEEECDVKTERVGQHLAIRSSWKRDEIVLESLDFSRLRSLTVSGEWLPRLMMNGRMMVLRVLDLEGTSNLRDEDLKEIGEFLPLLKFLSLRGCKDITRLPASIRYLGLLQTLDIRETRVVKLPKSIIKLRKLQYIRAGMMIWDYTSPDVVEPTAPLEAAATSAPTAQAEQPEPIEMVELATPSSGKERSPESSRQSGAPVVEEEQSPPAPVEESANSAPTGETEQRETEQQEPTEVVDRPTPSAGKDQSPEYRRRPHASIVEEHPQPGPVLASPEYRRQSHASTIVEEHPQPAPVLATPVTTEQTEQTQITQVVDLPTPARGEEGEQAPPASRAEEQLSTASSAEEQLSTASSAEEELPTSPTWSRTRPLLYSWFSKLRGREQVGACSASIKVPVGISKLMALHTLGVVNVNTSGGRVILEELKKLTQLRKLGLSGINGANSRHLPLASNLESLSLHFQKSKCKEFLECCRPNIPYVRIDDIELPKKLRSLKLYGHVEQMPRSIKELQGLMQLSLEMNTLKREDIRILGKLKKLHTLCLRVNNVPDAKLHFLGDSHFLKLHILRIAGTNHFDVMFSEGSLAELELLEVQCPPAVLQVLGLKHLDSLKQVFLSGSYNGTLKKALEDQLAEHKKKPALKLEDN